MVGYRQAAIGLKMQLLSLKEGNESLIVRFTELKAALTFRPLDIKFIMSVYFSGILTKNHLMLEKLYSQPLPSMDVTIPTFTTLKTARIFFNKLAPIQAEPMLTEPSKKISCHKKRKNQFQYPIPLASDINYISSVLDAEPVVMTSTCLSGVQLALDATASNPNNKETYLYTASVAVNRSDYIDAIDDIYDGNTPSVRETYDSFHISTNRVGRGSKDAQYIIYFDSASQEFCHQPTPT